METVDRSIPNNRNPYCSASFGEDNTITIGTEAANVIRVSVKLKRPNGASLGIRVGGYAFLSSDPQGDDIVASAPSGGIAVGNKGVIHPVISGKSFFFVTDANGEFNVDITENTGRTMYLCIVSPSGVVVASSAITFAA